MSALAELRTQEQRIVECLQKELPPKGERLQPLRSRALDLPAMLRRHGLMHVLLFLAGKEGNDRDLAAYLRQGIAAALDEPLSGGDVATYAESMAGMEFPTYLRHWEAAQAAATWLKLLVEARTKAPKQEKPRPSGSGSAA